MGQRNFIFELPDLDMSVGNVAVSPLVLETVINKTVPLLKPAKVPVGEPSYQLYCNGSK